MWVLLILALGGTVSMTYPTKAMCEASLARLEARVRVHATCIERPEEVP